MRLSSACLVINSQSRSGICFWVQKFQPTSPIRSKGDCVPRWRPYSNWIMLVKDVGNVREVEGIVKRDLRRLAGR